MVALIVYLFNRYDGSEDVEREAVYPTANTVRRVAPPSYKSYASAVSGSVPTTNNNKVVKTAVTPPARVASVGRVGSYAKNTYSPIAHNHTTVDFVDFDDNDIMEIARLRRVEEEDQREERRRREREEDDEYDRQRFRGQIVVDGFAPSYQSHSSHYTPPSPDVETPLADSYDYVKTDKPSYDSGDSGVKDYSPSWSKDSSDESYSSPKSSDYDSGGSTSDWSSSKSDDDSSSSSSSSSNDSYDSGSSSSDSYSSSDSSSSSYDSGGSSSDW